MTKCYFITGTDTKVGKTLTSISLLQIANHNGYITAGYKPISTGSSILPDGLRNDDALKLQKNSSLSLTYQEVNPYAFHEPTAPHILSAKENKLIEFSVLSSGLDILKRKANFVLIEGIGGWFTPISDKYNLADWVSLENLPVILVVGIKLGCINHAMLTAQVIHKSGVNLSGWIANNISSFGKWYTEYVISLTKLLGVPLLGEIPWLYNRLWDIDISQYFNINLLNKFIFCDQ